MDEIHESDSNNNFQSSNEIQEGNSNYDSQSSKKENFGRCKVNVLGKNGYGPYVKEYTNRMINHLLPSSTQQDKSYIDKTEQTIYDFTNEIVFEFEEKKLYELQNIFDG
ncbi:19906_t:CDS:2, partial [Gigaspora rosea]